LAQITLDFFYKLVASRSNHKTGIAPIKNVDGQLIVDAKKKSEDLNDFFVGIGTIDDGNLPILPPVAFNHIQGLNTIVFDCHSVYMVLSKLPSRSTCGPDGLPQILFKQMACQLTKPLVFLFRQLLQIGELPDIWKIATVTPMFKKGSSSDPGNYRPISVTSVCCKIFESAIKKPLMEYFLSNDFISVS